MIRICGKCKNYFEESELEISHDIPKYMGGTDKDGRHFLCKTCHRLYEDECLRLASMNLISKLPEDKKKIARFSADVVRRYFFKEDKDETL